MQKNAIDDEKAAAIAELENFDAQTEQIKQKSVKNEKSGSSEKIALDLSQYNSSNPLALLMELPILKSIQNYEEKLSKQLSQIGSVGGDVLGAIDSPFIDIVDVQLSQTPKLVVLENIPSDCRVAYEMACQLLDEMCIKLEIQIVKLLVASSLPKTGYQNNAFRNSYFFDERAQTVFFHVERFKDVGSLSLVIAHFAAHLKGNEFTNDNDIKFLTAFFSTIRVLLALSFKKVKIFMSFFVNKYCDFL